MPVAGYNHNECGHQQLMHWVHALRDSLQPFAKGVYVNQVSETSEELVRGAFGTNLDRLRKIKKKTELMF